MKKIFTYVAAALLSVAPALAGENLLDPATATLESWFADANWGEETNSTAVYDAAAGTITVNISENKTGQWKAQVKLHTGLTELSAEKQYDLSVHFASNVAFGNVTVKMFDNAEFSYAPDISLTANGDDVYTATNIRGGSSNGVLVFDFGSAPKDAQIVISDIRIEESDTHLYSCGELAELENNTEILMDAFTVVYVQDKYTWIKDATGVGLIYKANFGLVAGDQVAAGLEGKVSIYKNLLEIVPTSTLSDLSVQSGAAPRIETATEVPTKANMNSVVVYKRVSVAEDTEVSSTAKNATLQWGDETIALYNQFGLSYTFEAGKEYNVTAANAIFNDNLQAYLLAVEEYEAPALQADTVDHGMYDAAHAVIEKTYFATTGNWAADAESYAEIVDGQVLVHLVQSKEAQWQSQVFVDTKAAWEANHLYRMEFDLETNNTLGGVVVKVNDSDNDVWYYSYPNDNKFIGGTDVHFVADSITVGSLDGQNGLLIFSFGWVAAGTEIRIHNIRIEEIGTFEPEEEHVYIKHPWGTGADADWTWEEMSEEKYSVYAAYGYTGLWGGVGCNINKVAEDANAAWYAASSIQFLSTDEIVVDEPAIGTEVHFVYVPDLAGSSVTSAVKVIYEPATAVENVSADVRVMKTIVDGQIVIMRNGEVYNVLGNKQ